MSREADERIKVCGASKLLVVLSVSQFTEGSTFGSEQRVEHSKVRSSKLEVRSSASLDSRTARVFDCALDILWSDRSGKRGLIQLFKCLSEEVVKLTFTRNTWGGIPSSCTVHLLGDIEERHWERFTFYAKRVRTLQAPALLVRTLPMYSLLVHPKLVDAINTRAPLGGVCPSLRQLYISVGISKPAFLEIFLCANLEKLSLDFRHIYAPDSHAQILNSISAVPIRCPALAALDLDCNPFNHSPAPFLAQFDNLRELCLDGLNPAHFPISPSFSMLIKLNIKFRGDLHPSIVLPDVAPVCARLEWLQISGTPAQILAVLDHVSQSPLQTLGLLIQPAPDDGLDSITHRVADRCRRDTLRRIFIDEVVPQGSMPMPIADLTSDCLRHLFVFTNVEQFKCRIPQWLYPNDDLIITLVKSWPKLVSFHIERSYQWPELMGHPTLTIHCLGVLAAHCSQLAHLFIEFDAVVGDDFEMKAPIVTGACETSSRVRTLQVGRSAIDAAPPVATYLANIFPQLEDISMADDPAYDSQNDPIKENWDQVRKILLLG